MTTTPTKTNSTKEVIKSVMWLVEATFRGFAGYMLLNNFRHNYVAVAAGLYALITAAMIVVAHFVKAHK
jgi:hypothetical protein